MGCVAEEQVTARLGMLPRNRLITTTDSEKLATWIDDLSDRVAMLLDTQGDRRTDE